MLESRIKLNENLLEGNSVEGTFNVLTSLLPASILLNKLTINVYLNHEDIHTCILTKEIETNVELTEWKEHQVPFSFDVPAGYISGLYVEMIAFSNEEVITKNKEILVIDHLDMKLKIIEYFNSFYGTEPYSIIEMNEKLNKPTELTVLCLYPEYENKELKTLEILYLRTIDVTNTEIAFGIIKEYSHYKHTDENGERIFEEIKDDEVILTLSRELSNIETIAKVGEFIKEHDLVEIPEVLIVD